jgi:hypothetical protein
METVIQNLFAHNCLLTIAEISELLGFNEVTLQNCARRSIVGHEESRSVEVRPGGSTPSAFHETHGALPQLFSRFRSRGSRGHVCQSLRYLRCSGSAKPLPSRLPTACRIVWTAGYDLRALVSGLRVSRGFLTTRKGNPAGKRSQIYGVVSLTT